MIELELSIKVLNSILFEDLSFKKALKKHIAKNKSGLITIVSGLVGCELRHHLFIEYLLKGEYSNEQKCACFLALANHFFYKRIDNKLVNEVIKNHFSGTNADEIINLLSIDKSPFELFDLDKNSPEFASIRFNTPLWITKMWKKHYGSANLYKVLKANNKQNDVFVKVDNSISVESLSKKYAKTIEYFNDLNYFRVEPKVRYKDFEEYKNNQLITINPLELEIIKKFHNNLINEFTIFSGTNDSFIENFVLSLPSNSGVNVVVPDLSKRTSLLRFIRLRKAKNINLFAANNETMMRTGISHEQEIIYCYPESTSFNKIPLYPDYLLHIKRENLDGLILNQKNSLDNCSKFVMKNGLLIYIVDTLSKKETTSIVNDFLSTHKDFSLIEEKQYFPYENQKSSMFYAVFKKIGETND